MVLEKECLQREEEELLIEEELKDEKNYQHNF